MRVAFICFYKAWPPEGGAATVTYHVLHYTIGQRLLIQLNLQRKELITPEGIQISSIKGATDNRTLKIINFIPVLARFISRLKLFRPDVIVLEGASWVVFYWFLILAIRLILGKRLILYHAHNVEYVLRGQKHNHFIAFLTKIAEGYILRCVDQSFAVSNVDRNIFYKLYRIQPELLPNGVNINSFNNIQNTLISKTKISYGLDQYTFLFTGSYLYKPNTEGLDFLINKIMPRIVRIYPKAKLAVLGSHLPFNKPWLINPGCLPHKTLPAFIKSCSIGLAPIFSGSGTRLKILEYMAAELPVISTNKGAEGLPINHLNNIFIADTENDFIGAIQAILDSPELYRRLSLEGKKMVAKFFDWPEIIKSFNSFIINLFNSRERTPNKQG